MSPMSFSQAGTSGASSASAAGAAAARFRGPVSFHPSLDDELDDDPGAGLAAALALDAAQAYCHAALSGSYAIGSGQRIPARSTYF